MLKIPSFTFQAFLLSLVTKICWHFRWSPNPYLTINWTHILQRPHCPEATTGVPHVHRLLENFAVLYLCRIHVQHVVQSSGTKFRNFYGVLPAAWLRLQCVHLPVNSRVRTSLLVTDNRGSLWGFSKKKNGLDQTFVRIKSPPPPRNFKLRKNKVCQIEETVIYSSVLTATWTLLAPYLAPNCIEHQQRLDWFTFGLLLSCCRLLCPSLTDFTLGELTSRQDHTTAVQHEVTSST